MVVVVVVVVVVVAGVLLGRGELRNRMCCMIFTQFCIISYGLFCWCFVFFDCCLQHFVIMHVLFGTCLHLSLLVSLPKFLLCHSCMLFAMLSAETVTSFLAAV